MLFYQQDTVTFCNEKVQKQLGGSDCGLMALAFATDLLPWFRSSNTEVQLTRDAPTLC